jgi:hypothetical protein
MDGWGPEPTAPSNHEKKGAAKVGFVHVGLRVMFLVVKKLTQV